MLQLHILDFIKNNADWKELLTNPPYCIKIKEDDDYYLLKYSQTDSDFSSDIVKECRGLILDRRTLQPKALSFIKFFNIEEPNADRIAWKNCRVQTKVDGSKLLVWWDKDKWHISTSGELDAYKANVSDFGITFGELFDKALYANGLSDGMFFKLLDPKYCYTFELVAPESQIVIRYNKPDIYFIGLRDVETFEELDPDIETALCNLIKRPKYFDIHSADECIKAAQSLHLKQEGFVVVDYKWRRVKVKSPAYVQAHYLRNNGVQSQSKLLEIIEAGEKAEFISYFPEWKEKLEMTENLLLDFKHQLHDSISATELWLMNNDHTKKELAEYIIANHAVFQAFLFKYFKIDKIKYFIDNEWLRLSKDKKFEYLNMIDNKKQETV